MYICSKTESDDPKTVLFYAADTDYSGTIDPHEFKVILQKIGVEYTQEEMDSWLQIISSSKDGTINYEMFTGFLATMTGQ